VRMTPGLLVIGGLVVFWVAFTPVVLVPTYMIPDRPSSEWREPSDIEEGGRAIYISEGCTYCHSMYVRPQDWIEGASRIAEFGDYHNQAPHLLGSSRTGPDLSQEGGQHSDDWHVAHFGNPRSTRPDSLMPRFNHLAAAQANQLIAYVQSLGGHDADARMEAQRRWSAEATRAYQAGIDANIKWLHDNIPPGWRPLPNPYPATAASLARGERIYQSFCIGCHGPVGDGQGPAAKDIYPPPLNFAALKRNLADGKYIGGILYYQIMNGITGTAMPYFKMELESAKIWDVSNYVAVSFIDVDDSNTEPRGIDAASETPGEHQSVQPPPSAAEIGGAP